MINERTNEIRVNCLDKSGLNPLDMLVLPSEYISFSNYRHCRFRACFKGDEKVAKLLIEKDADVNNRAHEQGYSCLMFAALAGNGFVMAVRIRM